MKSEFAPMGDQPEAIRQLVEGVRAGQRAQVLQGVTGSGKTFTVANVIKELGRPRQRGGVLRELLRLLPAGGLHPGHQHIH